MIKQLYKPEKSDMNEIPSCHWSLSLIITKKEEKAKKKSDGCFAVVIHRSCIFPTAGHSGEITFDVTAWIAVSVVLSF